ncbi:MAG: NRDE family protein [Clostridia bacterium]|nr:NRDE family protein [Clostridia bacterium]
MCIILFAYKVHPQYPLILLANRDEYYQRPTLRAQFWPDHPHILGGRDGEKNGTWLGITTTGRFAAITNYRDPSLLRENPRSRGELVSNYLIGSENPKAYLNHVKANRESYNGFNLLVGDSTALYYYSQITNSVQEVSPGIHGLSNRFLDTPWPKVVKGKSQLTNYLESSKVIDIELKKILLDTEVAKDNELPNTGVGLEFERILSPIFIKSPDYGTRSSTILLVNHLAQVQLIEGSYLPEQDQWNEVSYQFYICDGF